MISHSEYDHGDLERSVVRLGGEENIRVRVQG